MNFLGEEELIARMATVKQFVPTTTRKPHIKMISGLWVCRLLDVSMDGRTVVEAYNRWEALP